MNFRVAVADDEPLARAMVANLVRQDADVTGVFECSSGRALVDTAARTNAEIVFVDVEMPGIDGLKAAMALKDARVAIVFVTAFGEYAAAAFDVAAVDYLVKPFSDARFREALERAKTRVREHRISELANQTAALVGKAAPENPGPPDEACLRHLPVKERGRILMVRTTDVAWIEAEDYCVVVHTVERRSHLLRASLASLEQRLDPRDFLRVHRTALINLAHVRSMESADPLRLSMSDGSVIPVSRARRSQVQAMLAPRLRRPLLRR